MGCPPVRRENPRALTSGLSYVQVDKHGITFLYHLAHHEIFRAKVGKGGINDLSPGMTKYQLQKVAKIYQRITAKFHAHLQALTKNLQSFK